ncbi:hypothetical protein R3Q06_20075 [Rhodococcus erythropolis]|uniref:CG0192-related protein n=1 Tax=Rhodococcus erythropolis TaxID=1833 RepID=UPI00294A0CBA|nr:hypothetical protein [Rhodococcus erythropolis]MDV6275797.1 hypothetical protein [Rhodococcus erythropolis]
MAIIHRAQLNPSKNDLLREWVPKQPWLGSVDCSTLERVDAYRFDDPDGEVGIETHLLRSADGRILQVPLTYRGAQLAGADAALIATMDHSVLGERWVYDACCDPVYVTALAAAILTGGTGVELVFADSGEHIPVTAHVTGSGTAGAAVPVVESVTCSTVGTDTIISAGGLELTVSRVIDTDRVSGSETFTGTWPEQTNPALLAFVG